MALCLELLYFACLCKVLSKKTPQYPESWPAAKGKAKNAAYFTGLDLD